MKIALVSYEPQSVPEPEQEPEPELCYSFRRCPARVNVNKLHRYKHTHAHTRSDNQVVGMQLINQRKAPNWTRSPVAGQWAIEIDERPAWPDPEKLTEFQLSRGESTMDDERMSE